LAVEGNTMNHALLELYRHKTWATLRLIAFCEGLAGDHLDATIPGTYGTIRDTLRHLVESEEGYLSIVTRPPFRTKEAAAGFTRPDQMPDGPIPLEELAARIRRMGPQWETLAQDPDLPDREVTTTDGFRLPAAVPMAQAIHHGDVHRAHVLSILGARGLEVPELDVWEYDWSVAPWRELPGASP
jgi:uncharacterized damage-inducible protein DinB